MSNGNITITLSESEALVLFEWLARVDEGPGIPVDHPAELRALWRLEGKLEPQIKSLFSKEYSSALEDARSELVRLYGEEFR